MIIDCVSDLHGYYPKLEGGDLLILAGDYIASGKMGQWAEFFSWVQNQNYKHKVMIVGNHDNFLVDERQIKLDGVSYLCDSGTEFEGLKIWGSPWTLKFKGQNPKAMAFCLDTEEELAEKLAMIPEDVDILVTHSPPYGILDKTVRGEHVGSKSLLKNLWDEKQGTKRLSPRLHVFGHIHESPGKVDDRFALLGTTFVNASHVNELYEPVNKPIRIEL